MTITFVVGTGRCGTRSLAAMLSQLEDVGSFHEPAPQLYEETRARMSGVTLPDVKDRLISARQSLIDSHSHFVDCTHWHCWLIEDIARVWPTASFIWLKRDFWSWAWSAYRKGWYSELNESHREWASSIRPVPLSGWPVGVDRWFKIGYLWQRVYEQTSYALANVASRWFEFFMSDFSNKCVMNNLRISLGIPGEFKEGFSKHKNSSEQLILVSEVIEAGYGRYLKHFDIDSKYKHPFSDAVLNIPDLARAGISLLGWRPPAPKMTEEIVRSLDSGRELGIQDARTCYGRA